VPPVQQQPTPTPPKVDITTENPANKLDISLTSGTGGGSGNDGSTGNGPGHGGGVGAGEGTGRGGGVGPGTGGGNGMKYKASVMSMVIPFWELPQKARPYRLAAYFEVDEKGNSRLLSFNPTKDRSFNGKLKSLLSEYRFRPATLPDGTPVRDTVLIEAEAP
jgi:hypothetical protein